MKKLVRVSVPLAALAFGALAMTSVPAMAQSKHLETIHHPNYDKSVFMLELGEPEQLIEIQVVAVVD
jgi:hypothetical protein